MPLKPDSADVQAMMALEAGALADAVARLSLLPRRSWLLIASNLDCLAEAVGRETADRLVAVADRPNSPPRPPVLVAADNQHGYRTRYRGGRTARRLPQGVHMAGFRTGQEPGAGTSAPPSSPVWTRAVSVVLAVTP